MSGSAGGSSTTERWIPNRSLVYRDPRTERDKILVLEFSAASDPRRRMRIAQRRLTRFACRARATRNRHCLPRT